ncbi:MAG: adenylate cyclase [Bdellovibrionota bacterium]|jgi:adenylate cyclase|nr:CYTH domain-containing protein [Lewinella sp.]
MAKEIERKFLISSESWKDKVTRAITIKQGYLSSEPTRTVRIRIAGEQGFLTIKGRSVGFTRPEFEYEIPVTDALEMIELCEQPVIEKIRYLVIEYGKTWEVDVFSGVNEGLTLAEIELDSEGEEFVLPAWIGAEVSDDPRYFNSSLIRSPFSNWE